jgi:hypothetical protein
MTEQKIPYVVRSTWKDLTPEQRAQVDAALEILTPNQLWQIATKVQGVWQSPGFGRVYITIEKSHPALIGVDTTEKLEP